MFVTVIASAVTLVHMQVSTQPELADDPCKDHKYQEQAVDAMRAEKDKVKTVLCIYVKWKYYLILLSVIVACPTTSQVSKSLLTMRLVVSV